MGKMHRELSLDCRNRIKQALLAGGLYRLTRKSLGRGLIGLALPVLALFIEDLSNPKGVILPFVRWLMSRHGKVKIIAVSSRPLQKPEGTGRQGMNRG